MGGTFQGHLANTSEGTLFMRGCGTRIYEGQTGKMDMGAVVVLKLRIITSKFILDAERLGEESSRLADGSATHGRFLALLPVTFRRSHQADDSKGSLKASNRPPNSLYPPSSLASTYACAVNLSYRAETTRTSLAVLCHVPRTNSNIRTLTR